MRLGRAMRKHRLVNTYLRLGDNARICLLTEPLWTIPYALYMPFVSVYMSALGLSDAMIGAISSAALISHVVFSLLSGALTDKLGRRLCTFLFDVLAWSVPALLWALARDAWWFIAAALLNGALRVSMNSWKLLLVEDEEESVLIHLFSLLSIACHLSAFAVLLSYPLVYRFGLVPTVRGMYVFALLCMSAKFVLMYLLGRETRVGRQRLTETRGRPLWALVKENKGVLWRMLRTPKVMWTAGLVACFTGCANLTDTFWPLLATGRMAIPEEGLAFFSAAKSAVMLVCFFWIAPRISAERFKRPLTLCFQLQILSKLLLIAAPAGSSWPLWAAVALDGLSVSLLTPLTESLSLLCLGTHQRALSLGLFFSVTLFVTSPLGMIGGLLSNIDRALPFALVVALCLLALWFAGRLKPESAH